jgi:phospholipid N-methyltransferase
LNKKNYFLKQFFKQKKTVGAISPSSKYLAKKMLENIDFKKHKSFVELGPGTGVFTRVMLNRMQPDAKLLVFELHPPFYEGLVEEFNDDDRVIIINDSAAKLNQYLKSNHMDQVDFVISSLPLANFNKKLVHNLIDNIYDALKTGGQYVQFQYSLKSKKSIQRKFKKIQIKFTSRNLPPAFVYCAKK